jgi:hypothetical protein
MASEISEIFDVDAETGPVREPLLFERPQRVVTTAHPFSEDDLRAFQSAGEHTGLE